MLPQSELQATGFFNDFLRPDGLNWGVSAHAHDSLRHLGDLRSWRRRSRPNFDDDDMAALRMVYPALVQALARSPGLTLPQPGLSEKPLKDRLVRFGKLSNREAEVAALAYEGLSD